MASTYELVKSFKSRYRSTVSWWRLKQHSKLVDKNLQPGEEVVYAFAAQLDATNNSYFNTAVLALTTSRLIIAQDRLTPGFKLISITPELYNDMTIFAGVVWGTIKIDTMRETIDFSNISKKALSEIQTTISSYMSEAKKRYNTSTKEDS